jgi:integrase
LESCAEQLAYSKSRPLQFLVLTMARPCEVRFMRKSEVNFIKRVWRVPADRMKMRRPHDVPLSNQALGLLRSVWEEVRASSSHSCTVKPNRSPAGPGQKPKAGTEPHIDPGSLE